VSCVASVITVVARVPPGTPNSKSHINISLTNVTPAGAFQFHFRREHGVDSSVLRALLHLVWWDIPAI